MIIKKKIVFWFFILLVGALFSGTAFIQASLVEDIENEWFDQHTKFANGSKDNPKNVCNGKYKDISPTKEQLKETLAQHRSWILQSANHPELKANFCGADLAGVDMSGADLRDVDMSGANLGAANLNGANLRRADMSGAYLNYTQLIGADLVQADLSGADLIRADLSGADLWGADLSGAYLSSANLESVDFTLKVGTLPEIFSIARARNLSKMIFSASPHSLIELREAFKKAGLREQEREITFAIERSKRQLLKNRGVIQFVVSCLMFIFFEVTSGYGLYPGRPLLIISGLIFIFFIPYMVALKPQGRGGIWQEWSKERILKDEGQQEPVRLTAKGLRRVRIAIYFSSLSAFHLGWRDLNVGSWLINMQPHEYVLRPANWVRTFSGIQSLISVYLLALSVLTYFGRPFE